MIHGRGVVRLALRAPRAESLARPRRRRSSRGVSSVAAMVMTLTLGSIGAACSSDDDEGLGLIDVGEEGPGTCLDVPLDQGPDIERLPVVACAEPHSHEIYAVALVEDDVYPGFEALETFAQAQCLKEFEAYVGVSVFDSDLFYSWIVPTLTSWESEGDREVLCVAGNGNGAPLVGTIRNTAR